MKLEKKALRITLIYVIVAGVWRLSNHAMNLVTADPQLAIISAVKSLLFLICTGVLLYKLVAGMLKEIEIKHQEALRHAERIRVIQEVSNDGLWDWNLETGEMYYDKYLKENLGYNEDETLSSFYEIIHVEDRNLVEQAINEHLNNNTPLCQMARFLHKDGGVRWIQIRGSALFTEAGKAYRIIGNHRDFTLRIKHEEEIHRLNKLYDALSQVSQILSRTKTYQETFQEVCNIAVMRGGFQLAWIGEFKKAENTIEPAAWAGQREDFVRCINLSARDTPDGTGPTSVVVKTGQSCICNDFVSNPRTNPWRNNVKKQGFQAAAVVPFRKAGDLYGIIYVYSETEKIFREKEVTLLEEVALAISLRIEHLDEEKQREYAEEKLRKANEELEVKVRERTRELVSANQELTALNEEIMVMNEKIIKAKEEAEEANHAKSDFLAKISHEIRTPLNAIVGLNYLLGKTKLTEKQQEYMAKTVLSANNLQIIINDVLDFSKIEAKKIVLETIDFDLYEVLNNVSDIISLSVYEKNLKLSFSVDAATPQFLRGDPFRLQQILLNLGSNAVKFTEQGGIFISVAVKNKPQGQVTLEFTVEDTGIGIPQEQQGKLFAAFSQMDMSTTRKYGGTGLGLAICKTLAELMGGSISVISEEGNGSKFIVTLGFEYSKDFKYSETALQNLKFLRVLLVCNNKEIQHVLNTQLGQFNFICTVVDTSEAALCTISDKSRYDLIIIEQDVREVKIAAMMRSAAQNVPIILVSAYRDNQLQTEADMLSNGFDAVIYYPVGQSKLYDKIVQLFEHVLIRDNVPKQSNEAHNRFAVLRNTRVLLVEDNEINQQVAKYIMENEGVVVDIAADGSKAVAMVKKRSYDIVLMDIQMPVMDGYQATKKIRKLPQREGMPIIALTADVVKGVDQKVLNSGMNGYITKPIEPLQLLTTLKRWVQKEVVNYSETEAVPIDAKQGELPFTILPGLNIQAGLNRLNGKNDKYMEFLEMFKAKQVNTAAEIQAALAANDIKLAVRLVHTLRGAAGNIGADDLCSIAAGLEERLREVPELYTVSEGLEETAHAIQLVIKSIDELAAAVESSASCDEQGSPEFKKNFEKLTVMVDFNQVEAVDLFKKLSYELKVVYGNEIVEKLKTALLNFDWDSATAILSSMRGE